MSLVDGFARIISLLGGTLLVRAVDAAGDSAMDEANDAVRVNVVAGSAGGVTHIDDAAFTPATDDIVPAGGMFDDTAPDSVDEGDAGVVRMSANRNLYVRIRDNAGNERGLNVDANGAIAVTGSTGGVTHIDDAAFTVAVDDIVPAAGMFDDTLPDSVDEGDAGVVRMSANRNLYVRVRDNAGNERGLNIDASGRAQVDASGVAVPVTDNASTLSVDDGAGSLTIDGSVSITGAVDTELPVAAALGDATVNPTTPLAGAALELFNGTTWDRVRGDITNGVDVDVTRMAALVAGTANIGDVDVLTLPALVAGTANIGDVDVLTLPALVAGTANIGDVDVLTLPTATNAGATVKTADYDTGVGTDTVTMFGVALPASGGAVAAPGDTANGIDVDVTRLPALVAGTANIGDVDVLTLPALVASTANIGDVDVLTLPALVAGTANIGDVDIVTMPNVTLAAGTNTNEVVGDVAHDAVAAGNPVLTCGVGETMADSAPGNRASTDGDAVRHAVDLDGTTYVHPHGPQIWSYHENSSAALTDTSVHAAPGVGLSLYVTDIICSTGAATALNIFFEEGVTTVLGPYYLEAVAGRGIALHLQTPKKITANTALTVTTSAAIAHGIDITGYTAAG